MTNRNYPQFLSTFDPGTAAATAQPTVTTPTPPLAAPAGVSVDLVAGIIDFAAAQQNRAQAQRQLQQVQALPATPAAPEENDDRKELERLRKAVDTQNKLLVQMQLDTYRNQAIANTRAAGTELVDGMVFGRTTAEIDASLQVAVAEYALLAQQWQAKNQAAQVAQATAVAQAQAQQLPPAAPQAPAAPQVPQGTVMTTGAAPAPQAQAPVAPQQPEGSLSLPGYVNAGNPQAGQQYVSREDLAYLTSPAAIRNGDFARNRHLLHAGLHNAGQGPMPNQAWGFNSQGPSLAPPMPIGAAPQARMEAPAMQGNAYAGVTMPAVNIGPGMAQRAYPAVTTFGGVPGRAPQPNDLQVDQGQGNYAPQPGAQLDAGAARGAAQSAIMAARGRAASQPPTH